MYQFAFLSAFTFGLGLWDCWQVIELLLNAGTLAELRWVETLDMLADLPLRSFARLVPPHWPIARWASRIPN